MKNKAIFVWTSILNFLFVLFQISGYCLSKEPAFKWTASKALAIISVSVIAGILVSFLFFFLYDTVFAVKTRKAAAQKEHRPDRFINFPILWAVFFVSYIPMYLVFYPGICAYDTTIQLEQVVSGQYIDHHPFLHTMLIKAFYNLGETVGNINLGIGLFVLLQMLALSAAFAASVVLLKKKGLSFAWKLFLVLFFLLFPFHVFMALSVAKVALFTAAFVPLTILVCLSLASGRKAFEIKGAEIAVFLLCFPVVAFRTNARYALMVLCAVLAVLTVFSKENRRRYGRVLLAVGGGLALSLFIISSLYKKYDVTQADRREMLSIPIQQMGRVAYYHYDELDDGDKLEIDNFMLGESWKNYEPAISDPIKKHVNTNRILVSPKGMLGTYLGLFIKYPGEYVNAVLALDSGYYYLADRSCLNIYGDSYGYGFVQTAWSGQMADYGITRQSAFPGALKMTEDFLSDNVLQRVPVLRIVFMPGYVLWVCLYLGLWAIHRKKFNLAVTLVLPLAYILTLIAGPTVQLRYIYPVWAMLPLLLALGAVPKED